MIHYREAISISPSDSKDIHVDALYVGTTGDVKLVPYGRESTNADFAPSVLFKAVPAGTILTIASRRVLNTGTNAQNILGLIL